MKPEHSKYCATIVEHFFTIKEAAARLGLPYFKLQRFIKSGAVPTYRVGNGRRLVRLSEIIDAIVRSTTESGDV